MKKSVSGTVTFRNIRTNIKTIRTYAVIFLNCRTEEGRKGSYRRDFESEEPVKFSVGNPGVDACRCVC